MMREAQVPEFVRCAVAVAEAFGQTPEVITVTNGTGERWCQEYSDRALHIKTYFYHDTELPYTFNGYDEIKIFLRDNFSSSGTEEEVFEWQAFTEPNVLHYQWGTWEEYLTDFLRRRVDEKRRREDEKCKP